MISEDQDLGSEIYQETSKGFDVTSTTAWAGSVTALQGGTPGAIVSIPASQPNPIVSNRIPILLNANYKVLRNPHLEVQMDLTFPYSPCAQPSINPANASQVTRFNATALDGAGAFDATIFGASAAALLTATYTQLTPVDNARPVAAASNALLRQTALYGFPDYALDFNQSVYDIIDIFSLNKPNCSIPIYETGTAVGPCLFHQYVEQPLALASGSRQDNFISLEQRLQSNMFDWSGSDPHLEPPVGCVDAYRAHYYTYDNTAQTITFTKKLTIPFPTPMKTLPLTIMAEGGNMQVVVVLRAPQMRVAPRCFDAFISLPKDSSLAYNQEMLAGFKAGTVNLDTGNIPMCNPWTLIPVSPALSTAAMPASTKLHDTVTEVLAVSLNYIKLRTCDLAALLGKPSSFHKRKEATYNLVTDRKETIGEWPTSSIMHTGCHITYHLGAMDDSCQVSKGCVTGPGVATETLDTQSREWLWNHRFLRRMEASTFVPASQIARITYGSRIALPVMPAVAAGDAITLQAYTRAMPLFEQDIDMEGVIIEFSVPVELKVPIQGATNYWRWLIKEGGTYIGVPIVSKFHFFPTIARVNDAGDVSTPGVIPASMDTNTAYTINCKVHTGAFMFPGNNTQDSIPFMSFTHNTVAKDVANSAMLTSEWSNITREQGGGGKVNEVMPRYNRSVNYTNVAFRDLKVTAIQPVIEQQFLDMLQSFYENPATGVRWTWADMTYLTINNALPQSSISFYTTQQEIYYMRLGLRNPAFATNSLTTPVTKFAMVQLNQGGIQVLNYTNEQCDQIFKGALFYYQPPSLISGQLNTYGMLKGHDSTAFLSQQIQTSIANSMFMTDSETGLPNKEINLGVYYKTRGVDDLWYGLNTHGGCASVDIYTQFQFNYDTVKSLEYRNWYGDQHITNGVVPAQGLPYAVDSRCKNWSTAANAGTYYFNNFVGYPEQAGSLGSTTTDPNAAVADGKATWYRGFTQWTNADISSTNSQFSLIVLVCYRRTLNLISGMTPTAPGQVIAVSGQ